MTFKEIENIYKENKKLDEIKSKIENINDEYIYLKKIAKYYWVEEKSFFSPNETANNLMLSQNELKLARQNWVIKDYIDLCYRQGSKKWYFNTLNENLILKPSNNPILDKNIEELINNVCWNKKENIDYLHKSILYKYTHINDFTIPSIVLYGAWWSWKWSLITLLKTIFWEENVLPNLWQRDLNSNFDTYKWWKLVVEFAEISTNNTHNDSLLQNKLKNIIWAEKITVNEKWVKPYQIDNIAWFIISSNSNKPLQLDDKDKWNRRFSIIKSDTSLKNWKEINDTIKNKDIVSNYLSWLYDNFPLVEKLEKLEALDNQDKRDLENLCSSEANQFWDWFEDNVNKTWKIPIKEIYEFIDIFCDENWFNTIEFKKYFWKNSKYNKKKLRNWKETFYGVDIPKKGEITLEDIDEVFWKTNGRTQEH